MRGLQGQTEPPGGGRSCKVPDIFVQLWRAGIGERGEGSSRGCSENKMTSEQELHFAENKTERRISTLVPHSMPEQEINFGWPQHGERREEKGEGERARGKCG